MSRQAPPAGERAPGTAALVVIGCGALVVAVNGIISLLTGLEVVPLQSAGPLVGPFAIGLALLALLALLGGTRAGGSGWLPLLAAVVVYLVIVIGGAVADLLGRGSAAEGLLYLASAAASPFTIADALLAALAGLVFVLLVRARNAGAGRPRWPWERSDEP
jgi:hypothetical protein